MINVRLKIINGTIITLWKINCSNFYFYTTLIYILCYCSGVAGWGFKGLHPHWAVKSCVKRAHPMRIFFGGGVEVGYFQTRHCTVNCLAVIGVYCVFYYQLLGALPPGPHHSFAPGPKWGTSIPRHSDTDPLNLQTHLLCCVLTTQMAIGTFWAWATW